MVACDPPRAQLDRNALTRHAIANSMDEGQVFRPLPAKSSRKSTRADPPRPLGYKAPMPTSYEADLGRIAQQERSLVFDAFDHLTAWNIGERLVAAARAGGLPIAFDISLGDTSLLYVTMPGAGPDNADWIRRKKNVVRRFQKSSYGMKLELEQAGHSLEGRYGVPTSDFTASGGCFPVRVKSLPLAVGSVTVSGLPQREDHRLVVRVLAEVLAVDFAPLDFES